MALSNAAPPMDADGIYEPLAADQIRLLHVLAVRGDLYICELKTVNLSDPGQYFAISHVWGDQTKDLPIMLNGEPASITRNVLELLQAIGNRQAELGFVMDIWIDSLCIHQESPSELAEQIPLMDRIYGQASCVFIFLSNLSEMVAACTLIRSCLSEPEFGRFAQRSGLSADNVYAFYELVKVLTNRFTDVAVMSPNELVQRLAYKQELPSANHPFWRSIIELMHHEWFYRVWTYQEVMLAQMVALLWKDRDVIVWPVIRDCRRAVLNWQMESSILGSEQTERLRVNLGYHPFLMTHHLEQFRWEAKSSLGFLVSQSTGRNALKAKDHVYGLLGIVRPEIRENIMIDYSVSDGEIFAQAFKATIQFKSSDLGFIWEAFDARWGELQGRPSWCPNFSLSTDDMDITLLRKQRLKGCTLPDSYRGHKQVEQTNDMNTIGIIGIRLDSIVFCTSKVLPRHGSLWPEAESALNQENMRMSARSVSGASTTARSTLLNTIDACFRQESCAWILSLREAFNKLGLHDKVLCDRLFLLVIPELEQQDPLDTISSLMLICEQLVARKPQSPGAHLDSIGLDPVKLGAQICVMDAVLTRFSQTYIFITGNRKAGLSIRQMRPGDNIVYLANDPVLKVISRNCDQYRGCAVVPGVVGDELPASLEAARGRWQTSWLS